MAKNIDKKSPLISVVMSVFNGADYVKFAIDSILNQTLKDFEFIIINDGSTDETVEIIKSFDDPRIKLINQENQGLVMSLNTGIKQARSEIIARQDADDVSLPDRLATELNALQNNPKIIIVGSSINTVDESGVTLNTHKVLIGNAELKQELLIRSPFAHGSVIFKKDAFNKADGYQKNDWPAEDYGLWLRMAQFGDFMNIDTPLYKYRENSTGITASNQAKQEVKKVEMQKRAWKQKYELCGELIDSAMYKKMDMGEYRIERITYNLWTTLSKSITHLTVKCALRVLFIILSDKNILRKSVRIAMIKLKLIHA